MPPRPPRAVCFDAFDTLVTLDDPAGRLRAAWARRGLDIALELAGRAFYAEARYYRSHGLDGHNPATLEALRRRCAAIMGEVIGREAPHRLDADELEATLMESLHFRVLPGVTEGLCALGALGVKLAVVSNWDCSLEPTIVQVGLRHHFAAVVASAVVGVEKPDPRIWLPALAALGAAPEETWHVGDEPSADVAGAVAAGLTPVVLGAADAPAGALRVASLADLPALIAAL